MALILVASLVGGCASLAPERSADALRDTLGARAGVEIPDARDDAVAALLAEPLDADGAVRVALLANPRVQALFDALEVGDAQRVRAIRPANPLLEVEGASGELGLKLVQPLLDLIRQPSRRRRADAAFDALQQQTASDLLQFVASVRSAWVDAVAARQHEYQTEQALEAAAAGLEFMAALRDAGNVTALAFATERAAHSDAVLAVELARADARERESTLQLLLGLGADSGMRLRPRLPPPPVDDPPVVDLELIAAERSLALKAARSRLETLAVDAGVADTAGWLTELDVGLRGTRADGAWSSGALVEFPLPLFDAGGARRAESRARLAQATREYAARTIALRADARRAAAVLAHARAAAAVYGDEVLPAHADIADESLRQYNAMQVGVFDLLHARRAHIDAWRGYIDALSAYWHARFEVDALIAGAGGTPAW